MPRSSSKSAPATPAEDTSTEDLNAKQAADDAALSALRDAYDKAIAGRDPKSGVVDPGDLTALTDAYRAADPRKRQAVARAANADALANLLSEDGTPDTSLATAAAILANELRNVSAERKSAPTKPIDPVPALAGVVLAMRDSDDYVVAMVEALSDEDQERFAAIVNSDSALSDSDTVAGAYYATAVATSKLVDRTQRRRGGSGPRGPRGENSDLAQVIRTALGDDTEPVFLSEVAKRAGKSSGALTNRHKADNVEGVACITVEGRRAFQVVS